VLASAGAGSLETVEVHASATSALYFLRRTALRTHQRKRKQMAKIVRFHQIGGPDVLKIEEASSREPGKGEAKLRVRAIGLNRAESMFMHGYYLEPTQLPATLGYEASGVVVGVAGLPNPAVNYKS
jgi:hypothetical protein